jgi:hypothetical protein
MIKLRGAFDWGICIAFFLTLAVGMTLASVTVKAATGREYYVALNGDDSNPGTFEEPWRTIQKAADTMVAGDTVVVRGGVYQEMVTLPRSGLNGQYITFQAYPGENPVLDGNGSLYAGFRGYDEKRHLVIDGFEIRRYVGKGILFEPGSARAGDLIVRNNVVHDIRGFGIVITDAENVEVSNNIIYDISQFTGIFHERVTNVDIHHNTVYWCNHNGIMLSFQSDKNFIHHNIAFRNSCGDDVRYAGIAIEVDSENNTVYNNLIYDNCHAGYLTNSPNNRIYHNVIYGNTEAQVSQGPWDGSFPTGNSYRNNIFVVPYNDNPSDPTHRAVTFWGSGYNPLNNSFDYNLYYYVDGPDMNAMIAAWPDVYSFAEWQAMGKEANGVLGDPNFVDPESADFQLQSNSIAIDKGLDVGIAEDFMNQSRPIGNGFDIGAYEFAGDVPSPTFSDVPFDHWAHDYIEVLYQEGYVAGCGTDPLIYCPEGSMTRAESAVFVERGLHGGGYIPDNPDAIIFEDVALADWYAKWVMALWDDGYTAGCNTEPFIFCPLEENTRAEGTVFFMRMLNGTDYVPPDSQGIFADAPSSKWYTRWVEAAYNARLIPACGTDPELLICPEEPLSRAVGAYMMFQARSP